MLPSLSAYSEPAVHHSLHWLYSMWSQSEQVVVVWPVSEHSCPLFSVSCSGAGSVCVVSGMWSRRPRGSHPGLDTWQHHVPRRMWTSLPVSIEWQQVPSLIENIYWRYTIKWEPNVINKEFKRIHGHLKFRFISSYHSIAVGTFVSGILEGDGC